MRRKWLIAALTVTALAIAGLATSAPPGSVLGGPWRNATISDDCAEHGLVCAEWPSRDGSTYCCIDIRDIGSTAPGDCVMFIESERDPDDLEIFFY